MPFHLLIFAVALVSSLMPSDVAAAQTVSCTPPQALMLDIELMLGRGKANDLRWTQFLAREVTPRFPDGLTVYETTGQWRDPATQKIARGDEPRAAHHRSGRYRAGQDRCGCRGLQEAVPAESVGIVTRQVCASF